MQEDKAARSRTRRSVLLLPVSEPRTALGAGSRELGKGGGRWQLPAASGEVLVSYRERRDWVVEPGSAEDLALDDAGAGPGPWRGLVD